MYFKFDETMRKLFNEDLLSHNVMAYLIYQTNYSESDYRGLKTGECYLSYNTLESVLRASRSQIQRAMRYLIDNNYIEYIYKSNSKSKASIIKVINTVEDTVNNTVSDTVETSNSSNVKQYQNTVDNTDSNTDNNTLSINISKNKSKNISNKPPRMSTTQIDKIIQKYSKQYNVSNMVVANELYKSNSYKNKQIYDYEKYIEAICVRLVNNESIEEAETVTDGFKGGFSGKQLKFQSSCCFPCKTDYNSPQLEEALLYGIDNNSIEPIEAIESTIDIKSLLANAQQQIRQTTA